MDVGAGHMSTYDMLMLKRNLLKPTTEGAMELGNRRFDDWLCG